MKVPLRILVILLSIGIVIAAFLPPDRETSTSPKPDNVTAPPSPEVEEASQQTMIRDLLGGAALDSGKKAKDRIGEIKQQRQDTFEEMD